MLDYTKFGISDEDATKLYNSLIDLYFGKDDKVVKDKIKLLSYIHMVWWNRVNEPDNQVRLEGCRSRLYKLLDIYDDLDIGSTQHDYYDCVDIEPSFLIYTKTGRYKIDCDIENETETIWGWIVDYFENKKK